MGALTREQLDKETREWRSQCAALGYDPDARVLAKSSRQDGDLKSVSGVNASDAALIEGIMRGLAPTIAELQERISALESAQGELRYCGVWRSERTYTPGSFATHDGGLWHAFDVAAVSLRACGTGWPDLAAKTQSPELPGFSDVLRFARTNGHASTPRPRS